MGKRKTSFEREHKAWSIWHPNVRTTFGRTAVK